MPAFSRASRARLATVHPDLQRVFERVILIYDCTILEGHRGRAAQDRAVAEGNSTVSWPNGKHNAYPSRAVDAGPYDAEIRGVNWNTDHRTSEGRTNIARFYHFAGLVLGVAELLGVRLRWGGDWDSDTRFDDQTFNDLVHFELISGGPR